MAVSGDRIEATRVEAPLFILGHYRSGTTHLHNLLALDPQFAAPTFFQVLNPHTFLTTERLAAPLADRLVVRRRYQDEMALGAGVPSEDEVALCTMTGLSPYMGWYFPRGGADYDRYLTFRGVPDEEVARWGHALTTFLKKLTLRYGRPLVLKSPPHTARIRLLLGLFPDARFVHIHRDPYVVFRSTRHMIRAVQPVFRLQECPTPDGDDAIISVYTEMYDAYFERAGPDPRGAALRGRPTRIWSESRWAWSGRSTRPWGCRDSRTSGPDWRATSGRSPAIARTGIDELPEPLTASDRPRVGPELRRVGVRALTDRPRAT